MTRSTVSTTRATIIVALLFWILFVDNFRTVLDMQRTVCSLPPAWFRNGNLATLHVDLRMPSTDPSVVELVLVVAGERPNAGVERVRSSRPIEVTWTGEPGPPLTWRAVALDRGGCIVYAGSAMWSPHVRSQKDSLEMTLRRLDVPLCAPTPQQGSGILIAGRDGA